MENFAAWIVGYLISYVIIDLIKKVSRPEYYFPVNNKPYPSLSSKETINYIQKQEMKSIDIICMDPILDKYTLQSIKRFAPWVNSVHVQTSTYIPKVYTFSKSLHEYALTSYNLSDRILILKPHSILTNYIFPWHFFIHDIAYARQHSPLCAVLKSDLSDYGFSSSKDIWNHCQQYPRKRIKASWDGYHDMSEACGRTVPSVQPFLTYKQEDMEQRLQDLTLQPSDQDSFDLEIGIMSDPYDDIAHHPGMVEHEKVKRLWVLCINQLDHSDKLRFLQRCFAQNHMFHIMDPYDYSFDPDKGAATIMRWIRSRIPTQISIEVKTIYVKNTDSEMVKMGERLSAGYEIKSTYLPEKAAHVSQYELERLRSL